MPPWSVRTQDVECLRALISHHRPSDAREARAKGQFLRELDRLEHPFDRDADPVHVTASAVVAGVRGTVLHKHRRIGAWLQPGGHVDPGERPEQSAVRETAEETGLEAAHPPGGPCLVHLDVHPAPVCTTHLDLRYLLLADDVEPRAAPGESPEVAWFAWGEAERLADDALIGALRRARLVVSELQLVDGGGAPDDR